MLGTHEKLTGVSNTFFDGQLVTTSENYYIFDGLIGVNVRFWAKLLDMPSFMPLLVYNGPTFISIPIYVHFQVASKIKTNQ